MRTSRLITLSLLALTVMTFVFMPVTHFALAQGPLVTCGGKGQPDCNFTSLIDLVNRLINYLIIISIPIAALVFAYAGFIIMTAGDNVGKRDEAKKIFTMVGIGLVFLLGGWLIIHEIAVQFLQAPYTTTYLGN